VKSSQDHSLRAQVPNKDNWIANIRVLDGVLDEEEYSLFNSYIAKEKVNRTPLPDAHRFMCYDQDIKAVFDNKLTGLTSSLMGMPLTQHIKPIFISYVQGSLMQPHSDGFHYPVRFLQKAQGNSNLTYCTAIIYLDVDCVGGELYFNNLDHAYVPRSNQMVVFPAHEIYRHSVKEVVSGFRDTCLMFYASDIMLEMHKVMVEYSPWKDL
jgi:predicted 2-oxoglutarate/Fe(II)-dependent dioxygenase YbiX